LSENGKKSLTQSQFIPAFVSFMYFMISCFPVENFASQPHERACEEKSPSPFALSAFVRG